MTMVLIGRHALNARLPGHERVNTPRDIDLIGTLDETMAVVRWMEQGEATRPIECRPFANGRKYLIRPSAPTRLIIEVELVWPENTAWELVQIVENDTHTSHDRIVGTDVMIPSLDLLYALKMSHRYLKDSHHFLKTMRDIQTMRRHGAKIRDTDLGWYRRRMEETYSYPHPKLNVTKSDFFRGDGVRYVYDHDSIHIAMSHINKTPAYRLYMKDGAEVQCDREKFFSVPEEVRLLGVLEEVQVLALERSQIPYRGKVDPRRSFDKAHMKVCTSITSGWFREYAWENYDRVQEMYEEDYVDRFWRAVDDGTVIKLPEEEMR